MAHTYDWWPRTRAGQLLFIKNWIDYLGEDVTDEKGQTVKRYATMGMTASLFAELMQLYDTTRQAYERANNEETRSRPATVACNDAFDALESFARSLKRRFFNVPPLSNEQMALLGFRESQRGAGPLGDPSALIEAAPSIKGVGYNQMRLTIEAVSGDLQARNNRGHFHTKYGVFGPDDPPPQSYKDLHEDIYSDRKKEFLTDLGPDATGKTIYFCSRIEQGDRKGPWGPMTSARVP